MISDRVRTVVDVGPKMGSRIASASPTHAQPAPAADSSPAPQPASAALLEARAIIAQIEREIATRTSHFGEPLGDLGIAARERMELPYWRRVAEREGGK